MSVAVYGSLTVALVVALATGGLLVVQRLVPQDFREQHNDVAGFIYAVLGVVYAVLLAFVVIAVWDEVESARETAELEANELAEVFSLAERFPEPERGRIQDLSRSYARIVVEEEWPLMRDHRVSARASETLNELRKTVQDFEPRTGSEQVLYDQGLTRVHDLSETRRLRILEVDQGIPSILWAALLIGGFVTVVFAYLFGLKSPVVHALMVAALALAVSGMLVTVDALEYPFSGDVRVQPDAFELVLRRLRGDFG